MVDKNTLVNEVIVDRSPQAADFMLEKTTDSRSPGTQKCDIQEINEDNRQTHKIYHCGTVNMNMNSFNARGIRMENCGNKVRASQVPIYHRVSGNEKNDENPYLQPHAVSSDGPRTSAENSPQNGVDYVMLFSASLLVISCLMVFVVNLPHLCKVGGMDVSGLL